jgi:hypothetical protein
LPEDNNLTKGLYYGDSKFMLTYQVFATVNDSIIVEIYMPFKGEIFKILIDTLHAETTGSYLFEGTKTSIYRNDSEFYVRKIADSSKTKFDDILITFSNNKLSQLNKYRNRAFIFHEHRKWFAENIENRKIIYVDSSLKNYNLKKLADSLNHNEFLKEYYIYRLKIDSLRNLQNSN